MQEQVTDKLLRVAQDCDDITQAVKEVLIADENTDITLTDGSTTPSLSKRVKQWGGQVTKVVGKVGEVSAEDIANALELGTAAQQNASDLMQAKNLKMPNGDDQEKINNWQSAINIALAAGSIDSLVQTWSGRTQESKNKDLISVLDFKTGKTDQQAIQDAVNYCIENGKSLNWEGANLISTANIANFWDITHIGKGSISRSGYIFYIEPNDNQTNYINAGVAGLIINDGLSNDVPTTHKQSFTYLSTIGSKALNGVWVVSYGAGIYHTDGVRINSLPIFKNRLQIIGSSVNATLNAIPTTIFDGSPATLGYWFHCENNTNFLRVNFKNIKIQNYRSGGIIIWDAHNVLSENVHLDNMPTGAGYRNGYARHNNGIVSNCDQGLGFAYVQRANVGTLTGQNEVVFDGNNVSINCSRSAVMYIQGSKFRNVRNLAVEVNRNSRVRTQGNAFESFHADVVDAAYIQCSMSSTYNPDNKTNPDTFAGLTSERKAYNQLTGGFHATLNRGSQETLHLASSGDYLDLATTDFTLLSTTRPDYVPFRLPAYILFTGVYKLRCEILVSLTAGSGGTLYLNPASSAETDYLARAVIPVQAVATFAKLEFVIYKYSNSNSIRYDVNCPKIGLFVSGQTNATMSKAGVRAMTDTQLLYRLFWKGTNANAVQFRGMMSYVLI